MERDAEFLQGRPGLAPSYRACEPRSMAASSINRVRRALLEENNGLRQWRRSRLEWRALQALIDATVPSAA